MSRSSSPSRKKTAKQPSVSSRTSNHKLPKITSSASYTLKPEETKVLKNMSQHMKVPDSSKIVTWMEERTDKTTSSTNLCARKLWNNSSRAFANPANVYTPANDTIQEESEVVNMLTKQLYSTETQMQKIQSLLTKAEERLRSKDQEIGRLKRKVKDWEAKSKNQELLRKKEQQQRKSQIENSEYLYKRCLRLEHKIFEMEKFLADYGLIWVGDANGSKHVDAIANNYIDTCYDQLIASIDQLNLIAGKGEVRVEHNEKGASFKSHPCMSVKFYKNGMIVQDGPLRPYNEASTGCFIRDILDGYFPSELQQTYPDGVAFKVEDHRTETYINGGFPGQGYRLGKQPPADNALTLSGDRKLHSSAKETSCPLELTGALLSPTPKSLKSRSSETPSVDLVSLRSQILASHNNVCSDSHLQSHINAELASNSRREKRELATKNTEYDMSIQENSSKPRAPRFPSGARSNHSSTDRSSCRLSPTRLDSVTRARPRSRSASLSSGRFTASSRSITRAKASGEINSGSNSLRSSNYSAETPKNPRITKSATYTRKNAPPILHQINEPTGKTGELRLKVRSLNGGTVYLVHVSADESVAKLYQLLDKAMPKAGTRGYKIVVSGYAPRRLEHSETSLRESGIMRDSVLHLVNE